MNFFKKWWFEITETIIAIAIVVGLVMMFSPQIKNIADEAKAAVIKATDANVSVDFSLKETELAVLYSQLILANIDKHSDAWTASECKGVFDIMIDTPIEHQHSAVVHIVLINSYLSQMCPETFGSAGSDEHQMSQTYLQKYAIPGDMDHFDLRCQQVEIPVMAEMEKLARFSIISQAYSKMGDKNNTKLWMNKLIPQMLVLSDTAMVFMQREQEGCVLQMQPKNIKSFNDLANGLELDRMILSFQEGGLIEK